MDSGSEPVPGERLRYLAPGLVAALAVAFTLRPLDDFDVWYHLAAGRMMWATWTWPATNTFSFTAPTHPWIDLHWVFQLLLYAAHSLGGPNGCVVLAIGLVLTTTGILYAGARRSVSPAAAALLLVVALTIASARFVPRPELLSFVLFATYLWLLDGYPRCGRALYLLVALQVLWVNSQGIFAIGLVLIGSYWLGATLAFLPVPRGWREAGGCTAREWRRLTLVLVLAVVACLANPYGLAGALFPLQLLPRVTGGSVFSMRIGEFRGPFESGYAPALAYTWAGFLALAALSFVLNARRWHLGRLLAVAAFAVLSTQALRNMALFAWIAVPGIAGNLAALRDGVRRRATRSERRRDGSSRSPRLGAGRLGEGALVVSLVLLIALVVTNRFSRQLDIEHEFGFGVSHQRVPAAAVEFARAVGLSGRPFNCLAMGGYLAWRLFPAERIFIDGRLEAYPESVFRAYFRTMDDPRVWPEVAARYGLDYAFLYHAWGNRHPLVRYLASGHGWKLVYYDEIVSLFVPTDEAHRAMRERAERAFAEVQVRRRREPAPELPSAFWRVASLPVGETRRQRGYGNFLQAMGLHREAIDAYTRALALDPDAIDTRFSLALAYWFAGDPGRAVLELRDILRRDPHFAPAKQALAEAAQFGAPGADAPAR